MKIIAIEEHFVTREVRDAWSRFDLIDQDDSLKLFSSGEVETRLEDLSAARLRHMDESGVDVQVISLTTPGVQNLDSATAVPIAQQANDLISRCDRTRIASRVLQRCPRRPRLRLLTNLSVPCVS